MSDQNKTLGQEIIDGLIELRNAIRDRVSLRKRFKVRTAKKPAPPREAWLYENEVAKGLVEEGLRQAKARQFSDSPPDLDDTPSR